MGEKAEGDAGLDDFQLANHLIVFLQVVMETVARQGVVGEHEDVDVESHCPDHHLVDHLRVVWKGWSGVVWMRWCGVEGVVWLGFELEKI